MKARFLLNLEESQQKMFDFAFSCIPREQCWWFSIYAVRINPLYFQISLVLIFSFRYLYHLYSKVFPLFINFIDWTTILKFYLDQTNLHHATEMILQLHFFFGKHRTQNTTKIPPKDFQNRADFLSTPINPHSSQDCMLNYTLCNPPVLYNDLSC